MAYKFQAGDATLSGSVTLVNYQDLLFETDAGSNIGTSAKAVGILYTDRLTASVGLSGSAIYADNFYGNGSNLTGVSADASITVTGSSANTDLQLVLVQNAGSDVSLAADNAGAIAFNPSTNLLSSTGDIAAVDLSGSDVVAGKSVLLGQNGKIGAVGDADLLALATNSLTVNGAVGATGAISGSSTLTIVGAANFGAAAYASIAADGDLSAVAGTFTGAISGSSTLSAAGNVQLDGADDSAAFVAADNVYFRDAGDGLMKRDSWSDIMTVAAGTAATTGLANSSGVLNFRPASLTEATIVTTDYLVFADANDSDNPKKEAVDDVAEILPALCDEAAIAVNTDYLSYIDGGVSGTGAKTKISSFVAAIADGTSISASNGQLSVLGAQNIDVDTIGNASKQLTSAGMNWATASITVNRTFTMPASPSSGDIVYLKFAAFSAGKHAVISGSGLQTIDGVNAITASSDYSSVSMVFVSSSAQGNAWRIF